VRGRELALDLPQQVDEVVGGGDRVDQRPVTVQRAGPVEAVEVRAPEEVPHPPAGLGVLLRPLRARVDVRAGPAQVHRQASVAVPGAVLRVRRGRAVGREDQQIVSGPDDQAPAVPADPDGLDVRGELDDFPVVERPPLQDRLGGRVGDRCAVVAEHPGAAGPQPDDAAVDRCQTGQTAGLDRERTDAVGRARGVDGGARGRRRRASSPGGRVHGRGDVGRRNDQLLGAGPRFRVAALAGRVEQRRGGRRQRRQVGPAAAGEVHVEHDGVVGGVQAADGQEREVQAVGGERRLGVGEPQRGDLDRFADRGAPGQLDEPDLGQRLRTGVRPGQPPGIWGEREAGDVALGRAGDLADRAGRRVQREHAAVVNGDREHRSVRGRDELEHRAQRPLGEPIGGAGRNGRAGRTGRVGRARRRDGADTDGRDLDRVLTAGVGDPGDPAGGAEDHRHPGTDARGGGQHADRTVAVRQ